MTEPTVEFRQKYIAIGDQRGTESARLAEIESLEEIAASDDIELAVQQRIIALKKQATVTAAVPAGSSPSEARQAAQIAAALAGGRQPLDNGDLVARAMGLTAAPTPTAADSAPAPALDDGDKVANALRAVG